MEFIHGVGKKARRFKAIVIPFWAKAASIALIVGAGTLTAYLFIDRHNSDEAWLNQKQNRKRK